MIQSIFSVRPATGHDSLNPQTLFQCTAFSPHMALLSYIVKFERASPARAVCAPSNWTVRTAAGTK